MKISISKIPGVFPNGYPEQLYIDARAVRDGIDSFTVETEKKHQIINDTIYRNRKIQSILYDKYTIKLTTTESVDVDMLNYAGEVIITLDNGEQHLAELIEIPVAEKLNDSEFREYTITYRDLYSKKTINHLVYSSVTNPDYYTLLKYNGGTKYTKLYPDYNVSEWDKASNKDNYQEQLNSEAIYKTISATFYIEDTNIQNFVKELSFENTVLGITTPASAVTYMQVGSTKYVPLETPEYEIQESELEGIKPVKVTIKYEQTINYPYA